VLFQKLWSVAHEYARMEGALAACTQHCQPPAQSPIQSTVNSGQAAESAAQELTYMRQQLVKELEHSLQQLGQRPCSPAHFELHVRPPPLPPLSCPAAPTCLTRYQRGKHDRTQPFRTCCTAQACLCHTQPCSRLCAAETLPWPLLTLKACPVASHGRVGLRAAT
jgi:hypothetical protein